MSQSACANLNSLSVLIISSLSFLEINYFNGYVSIIVIFIIIINLFQFRLEIVQNEKALRLINIIPTPS